MTLINQRKQFLKVLARPKVVVPFLLATAFLAAAASLTDLPEVFTRIGKIPLLYLLGTWLLAAIYLICKGLQFRGFLKDLDIIVPWRRMLIAYVVGEVTLTLPFGIYAQNYLLKKLQGSRISRSAAATTLMLIFEAGAFFLVLGLLGVNGWSWLRGVAWVFLLGLIAFMMILTRWKRLQHDISRVSGYLKLPATAVMEFLNSLSLLAEHRILVRRGYLTALYVIVLIAAFHLIAHGVGITGLSVLQAASIYAFSLSIALIFGGITSQVGVVEIAGMGAARMCGYTYSQGLAMLLGFRLVWMACIWLICLPIIFWLRGQLSESAGDYSHKSLD